MDSTMQSPPLLISSILTYGATIHADQEVVTCTEDEPRRMTYAEVGRRSAQLAHALRGLGIDGDKRVATFMWNNAEHLIAYLAVPSMGAVLHALNIRLFPQQLIYITAHAGNEVVIVDHTLAAPFSQAPATPDDAAARHRQRCGRRRHPRRAGRTRAHRGGARLLRPDRLRAGDAIDWPVDLDEDSASSMCYTSGTTGNPKGVAYSHRSNYLHSAAVGMTLGVRQGDRLLTVVPLFHANAWGFPYLCFMAGASLVMPDRFLQAEPLARLIERERVTSGGGVPTIWNDLVRHLDEHRPDVSSVQRLMVGGSACPPALMRAFQDRHGIEIVHGWGMTEMSPVGTLAVPPVEAEVGSDAYWRYRAAQGRLLPGVEARLIGPDGQEQPWDGESVGELEVRGPWVTASYYANGSESEAELAEMAAKFDDGWLRTGDVGALTRDGFLVLTDPWLSRSSS
jgi:fatty-acyl-CoA synthase